VVKLHFGIKFQYWPKLNLINVLLGNSPQFFPSFTSLQKSQTFPFIFLHLGFMNKLMSSNWKLKLCRTSALDLPSISPLSGHSFRAVQYVCYCVISTRSEAHNQSRYNKLNLNNSFGWARFGFCFSGQDIPDGGWPMEDGRQGIRGESQGQ